MTSKKARNLPVRILKIWFDVVLVLGILSAVIFLAWLAISPFLMAGGEVPSDANVQVVIGQRSLIPLVPLEFHVRGHELQVHERALEEEQAYTI